MPWDSQADQVVVEGQFQQLGGAGQTGREERNEKMRSGPSRDIWSREREVACRDPSERTYGGRILSSNQGRSKECHLARERGMLCSHCV
jgi:hypothetical protein